MPGKRRCGTRAEGELRVPLRPGLAETIGRIDRAAADPEFEVEVRAGRATGGAHPGNRGTLLHPVAHTHHGGGKMRIAGARAVEMLDLHQPTIAAARAGLTHDARCRGKHRAALSPGNVDAAMHPRPRPQRINPSTEVRRDVEPHRPVTRFRGSDEHAGG